MQVIDPKEVKESLQNILNESYKAIEDTEIKATITDSMEKMLHERVELKAENYEKNVFGRSLKDIKQTKQR